MSVRHIWWPTTQDHTGTSLTVEGVVAPPGGTDVVRLAISGDFVDVPLAEVDDVRDLLTMALQEVQHAREKLTPSVVPLGSPEWVAGLSLPGEHLGLNVRKAD